MINSLDEAILHAEEVAEKKEKECKWISGSEDAEMNGALANTFAECASEHRQLAEWLKELKGYREARQELEDRHAVGTLDLIDSYIEEAKADV